MNALKEDNGNYSTIRIVLIFSILVLIYQLYEFRAAFRLEIIKEHPDYQGLSLLFAALVTNFIFALILKVVQKRFESKNQQ
jgi:hypothetical protein